MRLHEWIAQLWAKSVDPPPKAATWAVICVSCVASFEGLRTVAYLDPVNIPTICFGETLGVQMGQTTTPAECKAKLIVRLDEFARGVDRCISAPMSPSRKAAVVSFSYNVGVGALCSSTFAKKLNAGDPGACDELLKWTRAKGVVLPGLVKRREQERALCLA